VLEQVAIGAPLDLILQTLVRLVEEQAGDMRCAVLLADSAQKQLRFVAAPHIPKDYQLGIEPYLRIAPNMGSCGTATFLRQPVYTRDTATSPLWKSCSNVAMRNGFRAVWSTPILSDANIVLGTFAMYYSEPRLPAEEHEQLIDMAVQLARVAIESKYDDDILNAVFEGVPGGALVTDLVGIILRVNHAFARMLGFTPDELHRRSIADIGDAKDNAALIEESLSLKEPEIVNNRRYRAKSGTPVWVRARTGLRRDASGCPALYADPGRTSDDGR
jgi:PAS domain S-box-containing protein